MLMRINQIVMAISQKEIAQHLGVSQALVGMALNDHPRISAATRIRVENAAKQLGYDRDLNSGARQMAAKRHGLRILNNVIAVCSNFTGVPVHQHPFENEILHGIESAAEKHNLDVMQCRLRSGRLPRLIEKGEVDGVISLSGHPQHLSRIKQLDIPLVKAGSNSIDNHSVSVRHYEGIQKVTRYLIKLGHRKIAYIGHDLQLTENESTLVETAKQRYVAYETAMQSAGLPIEFTDCSLRDHFPENGAAAFTSLWRKSQGKITAVICYNDTLAMGVVRQAEQLGLNVPDDLSVTGFDDISRQYAFAPILTSVWYDRELMGRRAVEILMKERDQYFADKKTAYIRAELPVRFVTGKTTAPVKT